MQVYIVHCMYIVRVRYVHAHVCIVMDVQIPYMYFVQSCTALHVHVPYGTIHVDLTLS